MTKLSNMIDNLKARQEAMASEGAFSLIDVVVTVAIVVALSVGGFIAYNGIVDNAKSAATAAAADQVYTAVLVAENDGFAGTTGDNTPAGIVTAYNGSSSDIKVIYAATGLGAADDQGGVIAVHKDAGVEFDTAAAPFTIAEAEGATDADLVKTRLF